MEGLEKFISSVPVYQRTPPMAVSVRSSRGELMYFFEAPAGFQLDRFVADQWSQCANYNEMLFNMSFTSDTFIVRVMLDRELVEYYEGKYVKPLPRWVPRVVK